MKLTEYLQNNLPKENSEEMKMEKKNENGDVKFREYLMQEIDAFREKVLTKCQEVGKSCTDAEVFVNVESKQDVKKE